MQPFVAKHAEHVIGTLSGFDRLVFRGTLRALCNRSGLMSYLWAVQVRLTDFAAHAMKLTEQLEAISHGEFTLNGLRNRDIRKLLFPKPARSRAEQKRQAAMVSRKLHLLRAHRLIRKLPHTHRYHLTKAGRTAVTALIAARNANTQELTKLAA